MKKHYSVQKIFQCIASIFPSTDQNPSSNQTPDPSFQQVDDLNDEEFCNYLASLSSKASLSTNDTAPANDDDNTTVLNPEKLTMMNQVQLVLSRK